MQRQRQRKRQRHGDHRSRPSENETGKSETGESEMSESETRRKRTRRKRNWSKAKYQKLAKRAKAKRAPKNPHVPHARDFVEPPPLDANGRPHFGPERRLSWAEKRLRLLLSGHAKGRTSPTSTPGGYGRSSARFEGRARCWSAQLWRRRGPTKRLCWILWRTVRCTFSCTVHFGASEKLWGQAVAARCNAAVGGLQGAPAGLY